MSPKRWRDDGASDDVRELLGAARRTQRISPLERRRSAKRVAHFVSVPIAASLAFWVKGAAIAAIGVASVAVAVHASKPSPSRDVERIMPTPSATTNDSARNSTARSPRIPAPPEPSVEPSPPLAPPPPASASASAPALARAPASALARTPAPVPVPAVAPPLVEDALTRETRLLEDARASLAADPARALHSLDTHARAFPNGQMSAEREFLAVSALSNLGRKAEARTRATLLIRRYPSSAYAARVQPLVDAP
jgi:hypothetical protein